MAFLQSIYIYSVLQILTIDHGLARVATPELYCIWQNSWVLLIPCVKR